MEVRRIDKQTAKRVVEAKHYSRRLGIFWEGFGLYEGERLVGVCCYGQPSAPIQRHAFRDRDFRLYELTRLVVDRDVSNGASRLVGQSLRMLREKPAAVISYADGAHGHVGIVYQSTNWLYTGAVTAHDSLYLIDGVPTHPMTLRDKHGVREPAKWAKENGIEKIRPQPKHRYFMPLGSKKQRRSIMSRLAYPVIDEYPKADKSLYDDGGMGCHDVADEGQGVLF